MYQTHSMSLIGLLSILLVTGMKSSAIYESGYACMRYDKCCFILYSNPIIFSNFFSLIFFLNFLLNFIFLVQLFLTNFIIAFCAVLFQFFLNFEFQFFFWLSFQFGLVFGRFFIFNSQFYHILSVFTFNFVLYIVTSFFITVYLLMVSIMAGPPTLGTICQLYGLI